MKAIAILQISIALNVAALLAGGNFALWIGGIVCLSLGFLGLLIEDITKDKGSDL
jgi:hypothetical protein